jgi:rubredoxin
MEVDILCGTCEWKGRTELKSIPDHFKCPGCGVTRPVLRIPPIWVAVRLDN